MRTISLTTLCIAAATIPTIAVANQAIEKDSQDPNQWVLPLGSYGGIRHSKLAQITPAHAVAWTNLRCG